MNEKNAALASAFVSSTYIQQGRDALRNREQLLTELLSQRRLPRDGWDDLSVRLLLDQLAAMDSNNFRANAGAGEREARIYSPMVRKKKKNHENFFNFINEMTVGVCGHQVAQRHFHLCHGVGRSGDIAAVQPKAAGSSLIMQVSIEKTTSLLKPKCC